MTRAEILKELQQLAKASGVYCEGVRSAYDPEAAHAKADMLLLKYIKNDDVAEAFANIFRWYS